MSLSINRIVLPLRLFFSVRKYMNVSIKLQTFIEKKQLNEIFIDFRFNFLGARLHFMVKISN